MHPRIITIAALFAATVALSACDGDGNDRPEDATRAADFREYVLPPLEDYAPMCEAPPWVVWNNDFPNRPVDCVMKATLCTDQLVGPQCAFGDPMESCWEVFKHCQSEANVCLKKAVSEALDAP